MNRHVDEDFHIHIYFGPDTRASALQLRAHLATTDAFSVELQTIREEPIGPHPVPMFNAHVDRANFTAVVYWLMLNHGAHPILIHPMTGDDLRDHTDHALWLGTPLSLHLHRL